MRRYRLVRRLVAQILEKTDRILVQTPRDAERFAALGACPERVIVTGNTKFAAARYEATLRPALLQFAQNLPILIAGSTAPGEERIILDAYRRLSKRYPLLVLIIAPRHLERVPEIEEHLRAASVAFLRASTLEPGANTSNGGAVLLLDTMGELRGLYGRAAIAFVGGSLAPGRGGQSLAEPAMAAVPVLFGPYYESQRQTAEALLSSNSGRIVKNASEIEQACISWLSDEEMRRAAGRRAREAVERIGSGDAVTAAHLLQLLG